MRRVALLAALLALAVATPAAAWVELPPYPIAHDGVADCLRAAGPGQLALLGHLGRRSSATDLLTVGRNGIARSSSTTLGWLTECAEVGVAPGAKPLLAAPVLRDAKRFTSTLRVADAGAAPATLATPARLFTRLSVAIAPNGAAVVAWKQFAAAKRRFVAHVFAAVRPAAGTPFGPVTMLGSGSDYGADPVTGIDAAGHATIAWIDQRSVIRTVSTTGGRLTTPQQLASAAGEQLALAVAPGGRTLIADYGSDAITAYERAAGAATFAPVPVASSQSSGEVALALADDGGAVIAYRSGRDGAFALLRRPGGAFGREQLLAPRRSEDDSSAVGFAASDDRSAPPPDEHGGQVAASLDVSGHAIVTWVAPPDRHGAASAHVARGTLAGGMAHATQLGSPCRTASAAQPLTLADGTLGAAWTDNARVHSLEYGEQPSGGGLLHVLAPGRAAPAPAPTGLGVSAQLIGPHALRAGQPLRLRVRCRRGPCVVRAVATGYIPFPGSRFRDSGFQKTLVGASAELPRAGGAVLRLGPIPRTTFAPAGRAPATISLLACPTRGPRVTHASLRVRLRRVPPRPLPRVVDLAARRHGSRIVVTWHTSTPARGATFTVFASPFVPINLAYAVVHGHGRRRFSVTLREPPGTRERTVTISVSTTEQESDNVTARIR